MFQEYVIKINFYLINLMFQHSAFVLTSVMFTIDQSNCEVIKCIVKHQGDVMSAKNQLSFHVVELLRLFSMKIFFHVHHPIEWT